MQIERGPDRGLSQALPGAGLGREAAQNWRFPVLPPLPRKNLQTVLTALELDAHKVAEMVPHGLPVREAIGRQPLQKNKVAHSAPRGPDWERAGSGPRGAKSILNFALL